VAIHAALKAPIETLVVVEVNRPMPVSESEHRLNPKGCYLSLLASAIIILS